jgi:hypothetical protein
MELLGKPIKHIQIMYRKPEDDWIGNTPPLDNLSSDVTSPWPILRLVPDDEYKDVRDCCIIKFAGSVTERLLGIDEKIILQGYFMDMRSANYLLRETFSLERLEDELRNAEMLARNVLSNPIHWGKVLNIANGMLSAMDQGRKPERSNDYIDEFVFSRDEVRRFQIFSSNLDKPE